MTTRHYILALSLAANGLMAFGLKRATTDQHHITDQAPMVGSPSTATEKATRLKWPSTSPEDLEAIANDLKTSGCSLQLIGDLLAPSFHQEVNRQAAATFLLMRREQLPWTPAPEWEATYAVDPQDFAQLKGAHSERMTRIFGKLDEDREEDERFDDWPRYHHSMPDNIYADISPALRSKLHQLGEERGEELRRLRRLEDPESAEAIRDRIVAMKTAQLEELRTSGNFDITEINEYALRTSPYSRIVRDVTGIELNDDEMRTIVQSLENSDDLDQISYLLGEERFKVFDDATKQPLSQLETDTSIGHLFH